MIRSSNTNVHRGFSVASLLDNSPESQPYRFTQQENNQHVTATNCKEQQPHIMGWFQGNFSQALPFTQQPLLEDEFTDSQLVEQSPVLLSGGNKAKAASGHRQLEFPTNGYQQTLLPPLSTFNNGTEIVKAPSAPITTITKKNDDDDDADDDDCTQESPSVIKNHQIYYKCPQPHPATHVNTNATTTSYKPTLPGTNFRDQQPIQMLDLPPTPVASFPGQSSTNSPFNAHPAQRKIHINEPLSSRAALQQNVPQLLDSGWKLFGSQDTNRTFDDSLMDSPSILKPSKSSSLLATSVVLNKEDAIATTAAHGGETFNETKQNPKPKSTEVFKGMNSTLPALYTRTYLGSCNCVAFSGYC
jgi:hypothetical protein